MEFQDLLNSMLVVDGRRSRALWFQLLALNLEVALPAHVNKVKRDFASKDLVNAYRVVERFVKNLVNTSSSVI